MRNFFMLFLLINLMAFAYQKWIIEPDNPVAATHIAQDYPRLTAVRLQRTPAFQESEARDPETEVDENAVKCIKIGPISREIDAESLVSALAERGIDALQSTAAGQVWVGHWVQVVDFDSRNAAEAARGRLVSAGLSDAYIVTTGDELKVSLGVFRSAASAEQTIAAARKLGYSTRMDERYQPGQQHWLTVTLPAGRELRPGELRSDTGQILRTEPVACAAAADKDSLPP